MGGPPRWGQSGHNLLKVRERPGVLFCHSCCLRLLLPFPYSEGLVRWDLQALGAPTRTQPDRAVSAGCYLNCLFLQSGCSFPLTVPSSSAPRSPNLVTFKTQRKCLLHQVSPEPSLWSKSVLLSFASCTLLTIVKNLYPSSESGSAAYELGQV